MTKLCSIFQISKRKFRKVQSILKKKWSISLKMALVITLTLLFRTVDLHEIARLPEIDPSLTIRRKRSFWLLSTQKMSNKESCPSVTKEIVFQNTEKASQTCYTWWEKVVNSKIKLYLRVTLITTILVSKTQFIRMKTQFRKTLQRPCPNSTSNST